MTFQKEQQEALKRAVAVAREYFISERRREKMCNQAESASSVAAGTGMSVKAGAEDQPKIPQPSAPFQVC